MRLSLARKSGLEIRHSTLVCALHSQQHGISVQLTRLLQGGSKLFEALSFLHLACELTAQPLLLFLHGINLTLEIVERVGELLLLCVGLSQLRLLRRNAVKELLGLGTIRYPDSLHLFAAYISRRYTSNEFPYAVIKLAAASLPCRSATSAAYLCWRLASCVSTSR
jgi:hypothetical protein